MNMAINNDDITMDEQLNDPKSAIIKKSKLKEELSNFLKCHTVYETIPENMKVLINLTFRF
jgi:hypothetical protein